MDNSSQVNEEKEINEQKPTNQGIDDIQFEDIINVDELQKNLLEKIERQNQGLDFPEEDDKSGSEGNLLVSNEDKKVIIQEQKTKNDPNAKKYVIYINPNNIDFMESLSINDRRDLVNKILKEQNEISIKKKEFERRKQYATHVILACLTFVICFPILLIIVNKSTESSITNYKQTRQNISKLYKEQGKIKIKKSRPASNSEY